MEDLSFTELMDELQNALIENDRLLKKWEGSHVEETVLRAQMSLVPAKSESRA